MSATAEAPALAATLDSEQSPRRKNRVPCDSSPWLNAEQAAGYLGRSRRFVLAEVRAGRLRAAKIGGRGEMLTRAEWLDAFVERQATPIDIQRRRPA